MQATVAKALLVSAVAVVPRWMLVAGLSWLAVRMASYWRSPVVSADIVGWSHGGPADQPVASPRLQFYEPGGGEHQFVSAITYPALSETDDDFEPLPEGPLNVRFRAAPFFAEIDDVRLWFTAPALTVTASIFMAIVHWIAGAVYLRFFS